MFSGCKDEQTSADVSNTASFKLPSDVGVSGAGGACTNALLSHVGNNDTSDSFGVILTDMVAYLEKKNYTQRPMLSTSRQTGLGDKFDIVSEQKGEKYAVMVGINYAGHDQGELSGCVNDVLAMRNYLYKLGFKDENIRVLVDAQHEDFGETPKVPTKDNLLDAVDWLASVVKADDTAFFHYSGHGTQVKDRDGDEADGMDEALVPVNYNEGCGMITDDTLFERLVVPMPKGSRFVSVMDCCHSGSILDLPYSFEANAAGIAKIENEPNSKLNENEGFVGQFKKFLQNADLDAIKKKLPAEVSGMLKKFGL